MTAPNVLEEEFQDAENVRHSAAEHEWAHRDDGRWLCAVCAMTTSFSG